MTCPICTKPTVGAYRPFCSKRCADLDLGKWLDGAYRVRSESLEDQEEALEEMERRAGQTDPEADGPGKPH